MRHIITGITLYDLNVQGHQGTALDIIPATGTLTTDTSEDGQTREINLSQKLRRPGGTPAILTADLRIEVDYLDIESGQPGELSFGTADVPARLQVADTSSITITSRYTELI